MILYFYLSNSDHQDPYGQKKKQTVIRHRRATCKPHVTMSQTCFGVIKTVLTVIM